MYYGTSGCSVGSSRALRHTHSFFPESQIMKQLLSKVGLGCHFFDTSKPRKSVEVLVQREERIMGNEGGVRIEEDDMIDLVWKWRFS